jgi:integrase
MAVAKITLTTVNRIKPSSIVWDTVVKGFGARRGLTDDVFYLVRYRFNGRQTFRKIGRHGGVDRNGKPLTPDTARNEARRLLGLVASQLNPKTERVRAAETFGAEAQRYLGRRKETMKPRAYAEVERHLLAHAKPLHTARLNEIDRRTIALRLVEIETSAGPVARNRVRSSLSAFFNWSVREGLLENNPVMGTGKADEGSSRERVLSEVELARVWAALPQDQFGDIIQLLVLTGQRRDEIGWLRWSEVDFDRALIVLPPERTKNRRTHELPLSLQARTILERQPRRNGREFVFGLGKGGFSGWSDCKARLDGMLKGKGKVKHAPWRLHDLRRTCATGMAELGVQPHIIEAVLNHMSGHKAGVAGIYNRARYEGEMRNALQQWADHVEALIVGPRKQPVPTSLMERAFAVARGGKIVPDEDLAKLARQLKNNVTPLKRA